jgi:hypothetical protein
MDKMQAGRTHEDMNRGPTRLHTESPSGSPSGRVLSARAKRYDLRQHLVPQYDRRAYDCGPEKSASQLLEGPAESALFRENGLQASVSRPLN